jgi:formamidopyrimidine-DNA glycosylase
VILSFIGKGNNRVKPTIAGCLSGGWRYWWRRSRIAKLGPDPLRQDADKEVVWLSMQKTKQSIGAFLMDQSMIAGIGNIYRSELLLVTGIHPDHCASTVSRSSFESLWIQAKQLMEIGVQTGYIITILTDDTGMFSMALLIAFLIAFYLQVCYQ